MPYIWMVEEIRGLGELVLSTENINRGWLLLGILVTTSHSTHQTGNI